MFNIIRYSSSIKRCIARPSLTPLTNNLIKITSTNQFHTTKINFAKIKKDKKNQNQNQNQKSSNKKENKEVDNEIEESLSDILNFNEIKINFEKIIINFNKKANEIKLDKSNIEIFNKLMVKTNDGDQSFTTVASTSMKGRKFVINVFDAKNVKEIINCVLNSNLNLNPQIDPMNKQNLNVSLPPITTETKKTNAKLLKQEFEKFKNGNVDQGNSLSNLRSDYKNKISKFTKKNKRLNDSENKLVTEFEKLHKSYVDKLNEVFKSAEQSILK